MVNDSDIGDVDIPRNDEDIDSLLCPIYLGTLSSHERSPVVEQLQSAEPRIRLSLQVLVMVKDQDEDCQTSEAGVTSTLMEH